MLLIGLPGLCIDVSNAATSDDSHTMAVTGDSHTATGDSHIALLEPEKQNLANTSVPNTEVSKAVPDEVMLTEIG